jgi:hypothetical protein
MSHDPYDPNRRIRLTDIETVAADMEARGLTPPPPSEPPGQSGALDWLPLSEIEMRSIEFVDRPLWQASAFHLLVGRKSVGKGTVLAHLAARVTRGELGAKRSAITDEPFSVADLARTPVPW